MNSVQDLNDVVGNTRILSVKQVVLIICGILVGYYFVLVFDIPYIKQILGLFVIFIIPGTLLSILFRFKCNRLVEFIPLVVGLSIAFLIFNGLLVNQLFQVLRISGPLAPVTIRTIILLLILSLALLTLKYRKYTWTISDEQKLSSSQWLFFLLPSLFPIFSAIGALNLNNFGDSSIAIFSVFVITEYVLFVVWRHNHLPLHIFEYSLIMIGLAILLSYSLRSSYISGWDIHQEYYVYQLSESHQEWRIEYFHDPYNACLSITVLPVITNAFLGVNSEYIFKFIYQLLFAVVPLLVYLIAYKYVTPILSYLASLFFVFQPWFIQPTPALLRQEIGLLFFALLVWIGFYENMSKRQREALMVVFGTMLILSHYSTAYISIGMLILTYVMSWIVKYLPILKKGMVLQQPNIIPRKNIAILLVMLAHYFATKFIFGMLFLVLFITLVLAYLPNLKDRMMVHQSDFISGRVILILLTVLFFWNNIFTGTMENIEYVANTTLTNLQEIFNGDLRSEDIIQAFGLHGRTNSVEDIGDYVVTQSEKYKPSPKLFPITAYSDFLPRPMSSIEHPGILGESTFSNVMSTLLVIVKQSTKVLLMIGVFALLHLLLESDKIDHQFILLNLVSIGILFAFLLVPILSLYYNVFRVYVQSLIVSSLSLVFGVTTILSFITNPKIKERLLVVLIALFFLSSSSVTSYIVGGPVTMNVANFGEDYDKFFTHETEVLSAKWLARHRDPNIAIYADPIAALRLASYANGIVETETAILPSTITQDSYVYLRYANLDPGITEATHNGRQITYNYPIEFLNNHKNLIYDNGGSQIFK